MLTKKKLNDKRRHKAAPRRKPRGDRDTLARMPATEKEPKPRGPSTYEARNRTPWHMLAR